MKVIKKRKQIIGGKDDPYMIRWFLIPRNRFFNVYLHRFCRADDDRALHDHPWFSFSILLRGSYVEHTIKNGGIHKRKLYSVAKGFFSRFRFRSAWFTHRIELAQYDWNPERGSWTEYPWTLFITGPKIRAWGFHCPSGWKHWIDFTTKDNCDG